MTAREAYTRGPSEFHDALMDEVRRLIGGADAHTRDMIDGPALVHGVTQKQRGAFYGAVAYGLWEEWAPLDPPLPCPAGLVAGYRAEEEIHEAEFRPQVSGPHSQQCAEVVTLSRIFQRRLPLLAPPGDTDHPRRLEAALRDFVRELPEQATRYGIATGVALRFLHIAADHNLPPDQWLRPVPAANALAEWVATGPFWVDIVKVGSVDDALRDLVPDVEQAYALRHGTERDHQITIFTSDDDRAHVAWSIHVKAKRLGSGRSIDTAVAPPTAHLWALAQLGFTTLVVGDYEFSVEYVVEIERLNAIREELIGVARGSVVPGRGE